MSLEQMKEAFRTVIQAAYGAGKLEVLDDLFAPDFVEHQADITPPTLAGVKRSIAYLRNAFPDMSYTIEEMHTDGDRLWARLSARGTQQGTFAGVPPTGKPIAITVLDECRFKDGKIVEHWGVADRLAALAQIGALPRPAQSRP
jgi:predicted ester cyclase